MRKFANKFRAIGLIGFVLIATAACGGDDGEGDDDETDTSTSGSGGANGNSSGSNSGGSSFGGASVGGSGGTSTGGSGDSKGSGSGGSAGAACEVDDSYHADIEPNDFVSEIDNPYWPLVPGMKWVYGGAEHVEVMVLEETKQVLGIQATVVRDTVADEDGNLVEDTFDWYGQDRDGNVWYLGEDTKEYEDGKVTSTEGSWEAGVDGAEPGIVMYAKPKLERPYRQEYYACQAEDFAEVLSTSESVTVPFGEFDDCIETHEYTPLEPAVNENKYYCADVGLVLEVDVESGDRVELTDFSMP